MKRLSFVFVAWVLGVAVMTAQTQQGIVKTIGKPGHKGQALSGVTVRVKGEHNAAISRADGTFSLAMSGKKNGQPYTLQQVQKSGYELNEKTVLGRQYAFSSTVPLTIVMVSTAQLQADKQRIENNAYKTAEKNYKAKMAKLEKQLKEKSISEEQYRVIIQELQNKFERYQSLIDELADHYAHTDYDGLSEKEAEINVLIENGELEKADSLIHTLFDPVDVIKRNKEALSRIDQTIAGAQGIIDQADADLVAVLKQQEKDAEYLYQLYTIALAQFDNEKASRYIQTRAQLDTTNVQWQCDAGRFVSDYLADYVLAMNYYQRGLRQSITQSGEQNDMTAVLYNNVGLEYSHQGDYTQALVYLQKSLEILEQLYDSEHPLVATTYNNIGTVYYSQGDYAKAREFYEKSLVIDVIVDQLIEHESVTLDEKSVNLYKSRLATSFNNFGDFLIGQGDYPKALEVHNKALAIWERIYGPDHPRVALSYNNIGVVYYHQGDYPQALEYYHKSLAIWERVYGIDHPSVANSCDDIGTLYYLQGDYARALEYIQKSQSIHEKLLDYDAAESRRMNNALMVCKYELAMQSDDMGSFLQNHCFTATVVDGDTPAKQKDMKGEYILLEFADWTENSRSSLLVKHKDFQGKPKDIVVLKDGVITRHHFENAIGVQLGIKQICEDERQRINQLYEQWKRENKN
jgi:tetratricopeptide (TPR) repeat protein